MTGARFGVRCVQQTQWTLEESRELVALKYASDASRQVMTLIEDWSIASELDGNHSLGVYHAVGKEKLDNADRAVEIAVGKGFDALRPTHAIFQYGPYGLSAAVAIALQASGPYYALEGDEVAGPLAVHQALTDISRGRAERALVLSGDASHRVWVSLFEAVAEPALRWMVRFGRRDDVSNKEASDVERTAAENVLGLGLTLAEADTDDLHGLGAVQRAIRQADNTPHGVFRVTEDGRSMLIAFGSAG